MSNSHFVPSVALLSPQSIYSPTSIRLSPTYLTLHPNPPWRAKMYTSTILLVTLAATQASANMQRLSIPYPRVALEQRGLAARQTDDDTAYPTATEDAACESAYDALASLVTDMPTPPPALESWALTETDLDTVTDECSFSVPASVSSDYAAYSSSLLSWYDAHTSEFSSAVAQCTDLAEETSDLDACTSSDGGLASASSTAAGAASNSASATATGSSPAAESTGASTKTTLATTASSASTTGASSASSSSSAVATAGAAAREVGLAGAVLAVVLGAVVAL